jgi:hypothetical protein
MALGLSFGKKTAKTDQTTKLSGTETQTQTGLTGQQQVETSDQTVSGLSSTSTTGENLGAQSGTSALTTAGTESQKGTTTLFSDSVLAALESAGLGSLARVAGAAPVDASGLDFDSDQFVNDAVTRATAAATMSRQSAQGGLYDNLGGTSGGNTMAALLDQQLANQEAASIAGARNEATATAAGIERDNIGAELAVRGQDQGFAGQLLELLRGGVATSDVATDTNQQQRQENQSISQELQNQQQQQATEQQTSTVNSLVSLIQQLVSGTTTTDTTENVKGKTTSKGMGISAGI